jgi:hypothetical protein
MIDTLGKWFDDGCPVTEHGIPQEAKAYFVKRTAKDHGLSTLVETGTGFGDLLIRVVDDFDRIYSVELQPDFYATTVERFKDIENVALYNGESSAFVKDMTIILDEGVLWFLDAHYAGPGTARADKDTPVMEELGYILGHDKRHVIIIDDARLFGKEKEYPTLQEVYDFAEKHGYTGSVWGDEIVLI